MKKTISTILPLTLALAAYAGQSVAQENGKNCKGDPAAPHITLNLNTMKATPECALAHLGANIVLHIVPKKDLGEKIVLIEPKNPLDSWLQGDNSQLTDLIIIRVPGAHNPEDVQGESSVHGYNIVVDGVKHDPRIKVEY